MNKAELARQLGVSRAYITMIANGKRKPSEDIVNKLNSLSLETNQIVNKSEANLLTLNQQVTGSIPVRLTNFVANSTHFLLSSLQSFSILSSLLNKIPDFSLNSA